ncbi:hypothetical protein [Methylovirgula sp. HY1]|uniref:hypothetical protein n=1 Tax=Methylovirgula sp. HY1 TaxID=2822761 RepID=UPI001C5AB7F3|nr:hypothetical protein [Methylovirgula sp. HY1]QXX74102.1 hypothetical protein MHY1_00909 [Methylovirgula sp. HY1]
MTLTESAHPSPQRRRVGLVSLAIGLTGAPAAWVTQLVVNYGLSSYACYPASVPRGHVLPGWENVRIALLIINLLALMLAVGTTFLSYRNWVATRDEHPGALDDLVAAGEGRTRFIGLAGAISGIGFALAIVFDLIAVLGVPQCSG